MPIPEETCELCSEDSTTSIKVNGGNLKPIFNYEKKFYNEIIDKTFGLSDDLIPPNLCFSSNGYIIVDGNKVFKIFLDKENLEWKAKTHQTYNLQGLEGSDLKKVIRANKHRLKDKEQEALSFLKETIDMYDGLPPVVSFSGGKDSAAVLYLTRKIERNIPVVYLNTTLDFPETVEYVHLLQKKWQLNLTEIYPECTFLDLCHQLGPPSSMMPWCCQTQKFAPFNRYLNENFPKGLLSIEGLRRSESTQRSKYERISKNKAIPKKLAISPILDWTALDVWLYTLWKKIPINPMYKYGYSRMGCWACPHRTLSLFKLSEKTHPELMKTWYSFLEDYALRAGKDKEWIYRGSWRWRTEPYLKMPIQNKKLCGSDNSLLYEINDTKIEKVKEFMTVFGEGKKADAANIQLINTEKIHISIIGSRLRASCFDKRIFKKFEKQLEKANNCVGCGACTGVCNALKIINKNLSIDKSKCSHCLECLSSKYLRMGCVALNYKKERIVVNEVN